MAIQYDTDTGIDSSFERFAQHSFYQELNRELVDRALATAEEQQHGWLHRRVVDVACGTGGISKLVLEYLDRHQRKAEIFAFDPSETALQKARRSAGSKVVRFVQGAAESLSNLVSAADVVLFFNAIHLVEDKKSVVQQVRDSLNPRGIFAFNTSFYEGAYAEGTQRFYRQWMVRALQLLRREHPELRTEKNAKSQAMRWLTREEYDRLLASEGFVVLHAEERRTDVPLEGWNDISGYKDFAEGALPGVPLKLSIPALQKAVSQVFDEMGLSAVPRNWYQVVAQHA